VGELRDWEFSRERWQSELIRGSKTSSYRVTCHSLGATGAFRGNYLFHGILRASERQERNRKSLFRKLKNILYLFISVAAYHLLWLKVPNLSLQLSDMTGFFPPQITYCTVLYCYFYEGVKLLWNWTCSGSIVHPPDDTWWIWSSGGMTLTGEYRRARRRVCSSITTFFHNRSHFGRTRRELRPLLR
jgi:hypothetical protein